MAPTGQIAYFGGGILSGREKELHRCVSLIEPMGFPPVILVGISKNTNCMCRDQPLLIWEKAVFNAVQQGKSSIHPQECKLHFSLYLVISSKLLSNKQTFINKPCELSATLEQHLNIAPLPTFVSSFRLLHPASNKTNQQKQGINIFICSYMNKEYLSWGGNFPLIIYTCTKEIPQLSENYSSREQGGKSLCFLGLHKKTPT